MNPELQKEKLHNYKNREKKKLQMYNMERSYN